MYTNYSVPTNITYSNTMKFKKLDFHGNTDKLLKYSKLFLRNLPVIKSWQNLRKHLKNKDLNQL